MGRLVHRSTDQLPPEAWAIMLAGFKARKTYRAISEELAAAGFNVPERTVARRAAEWRSEIARREALRIAATEGARVDLLEETEAILAALDTSAGWKMRARRRVLRAVDEYHDEPSVERASAVKRELLRERLEQWAHMLRILPGLEAGGGEHLGAEYKEAGLAGGGH